MTLGIAGAVLTFQHLSIHLFKNKNPLTSVTPEVSGPLLIG